MTRAGSRQYAEAVFALRPAWRGPWFVAAIWVLVAVLSPASARAEARDVEVGASPIVRVVLKSGSVNVRTWDRHVVEVDDAGAVTVRRFAVQSTDTQSTIPVLAGHVDGPNGPIQLPAETFAVSTLPPGPHFVVAARGDDANLTVTVPATAALVTVQLGRGNVSIQDYRHGTFVARVRNGSVRLENVGGDGFVQVMRGPITAHASSFERLRARSGTGDVVFDGCRAEQIEVTSVGGSIVYDGGSFEPGLARFETRDGNVAIGVTGGTELGGHSSSGRVYTQFDRGAHVSGSDGEQRAVVGAGGPVVNATSDSGNVFFYDGALRTHRTPAVWDAPKGTFLRMGVPEVAPPRKVIPKAIGRRHPRAGAPLAP
jgi:hypothetical protein